MNYRDTLSSLVSSALSAIAPIMSGTVVDFDPELYMATVRVTHRSGSGYDFYTLPWPRTTLGVLAHAPQKETSTKPGTHAVIGFRGFNWNYPILLAAYDPLHLKNTRQNDKRSLSSYTPRTGNNLTGTF